MHLGYKEVEIYVPEDSGEWLLLEADSREFKSLATENPCEDGDVFSTAATEDAHSPPQLTPHAHLTLLNGERTLVDAVSVVYELSCASNTWKISSYERRTPMSMESSGVCSAASSPLSPQAGHIIITNYRIVFVPKELSQAAMDSNVFSLVNSMPLCTVSSVALAHAPQEARESLCVQMQLKDWRFVRLTFEDPSTCSEIYNLLPSLVFAPVESVCSFSSLAEDSVYTDPGEACHIVEDEYRRLGLSPHWRVSTFNHTYDHIPSYPRRLIVPASISDEVLQKACKFRSNGRIPAVCWVSPTGAAIARSSQPYVGLWSAYSEDDETLVRAIFQNNSTPSTHRNYIIDCRPRISAYGNVAKGGGYEQTDRYSDNCEIEFMGVDNIHAMRESFNHMYKLCIGGNHTDHRWLSSLENTKWLDHLHLVIASAVKVVDMVHSGSSVLIHCSDGWDRTPQLVSLAMLLLDPFYRTIKGFTVLIEKEWISFGHKFQLRSGHCTPDFLTNEQCSPIFLQWVDCVWQVTRQCPECFEFNDRFLVELVDHVYSCRFREFLFNSEYERENAKLKHDRLSSLWTHFSTNMSCYLNPFYNTKSTPTSTPTPTTRTPTPTTRTPASPMSASTSSVGASTPTTVIKPDASYKQMRFWNGYYLRYYQTFEEGINLIQQQGLVLKDKCSTLENEVQQLRSRLESEERRRGALESKLQSVEHETEALRKRTVPCHVTNAGEVKMFWKIEEDSGPALRKLKFDIIEDYSDGGDSSEEDSSKSNTNTNTNTNRHTNKRTFMRKASCP